MGSASVIHGLKHVYSPLPWICLHWLIEILNHSSDIPQLLFDVKSFQGNWFLKTTYLWAILIVRIGIFDLMDQWLKNQTFNKTVDRNYSRNSSYGEGYSIEVWRRKIFLGSVINLFDKRRAHTIISAHKGSSNETYGFHNRYTIRIWVGGDDNCGLPLRIVKIVHFIGRSLMLLVFVMGKCCISGQGYKIGPVCASGFEYQDHRSKFKVTRNHLWKTGMQGEVVLCFVMSYNVMWHHDLMVWRHDVTSLLKNTDNKGTQEGCQYSGIHSFFAALIK